MPSTPNSNYLCIVQVTDDDGNTARDTAHINVLLDPPSVTVQREVITVREGFNILLDASAYDGYGSIVKREWSCGTGSITFPIVAIDSFGTIKSFKIDLDASGKGKPEKWKYKQLEGDSIEITIKYDSTKVDSIGNQKIYIIVTDDDDNETRDSVNLRTKNCPGRRRNHMEQR